MREKKDSTFLELPGSDGGLGVGVGWTEQESGPGQLEKRNHARSGPEWLTIRDVGTHLNLNLGFPLR